MRADFFWPLMVTEGDFLVWPGSASLWVVLEKDLLVEGRERHFQQLSGVVMLLFFLSPIEAQSQVRCSCFKKL
jgi:hypothetical protein